MTRFMAVTVALVAMVLGACGGSDGGERLTAAEFVAKANTTCAELSDDVQAAFADLPPDGDPVLYQGVIADLVPLVEGVIKDLGDLRPPADVEGRFDEALAAMTAGNELVRKAGETPEASATIFAGEDDPYDGANAIFDELGLNQCGNEPPADSPAP